MCLGLPARIVGPAADHPDLAIVDMAGTRRLVSLGVLDEPARATPGTWVLVHMGYALSVMSEQEARDAVRALEDERTALAALLDGQR